MNLKKTTFWSFMIAAVCFFVSAIIFWRKEDSMAVTYFCLAACFFVLALSHNKKKEPDEESKAQKNEEKEDGT